MALFSTNGISIYYEVYGDPNNSPLLFIAGLGGTGKSWGSQVKLFADKYYVILPDQRGTGQTTHAEDGYTTKQLAADIASLLDHLALGPVHVVGSSTGGAIGQFLVLDYPNLVHTITISSSFARFDAFMHREFEVRRKMAAEWNRYDMFSGYSLFLFSPRYTREHPEKVAAWIQQGAAHPAKPEDQAIGLKRIDMIVAHDALAQLGDIKHPALILCGDRNLCTPLPLSEELAKAIPGAELVVFQDAGELIELEKEFEFFQIVSDFIERRH